MILHYTGKTSRDRGVRRTPFAVEALRTRARSRTVQVCNGNTSTSLDRSFGACNMGFDPLEVFRAVFHADLEDASVPITDLDGIYANGREYGVFQQRTASVLCRDCGTFSLCYYKSWSLGACTCTLALRRNYTINIKISVKPSV